MYPTFLIYGILSPVSSLYILIFYMSCILYPEVDAWKTNKEGPWYRISVIGHYPSLLFYVESPSSIIRLVLILQIFIIKRESSK